MPTNCCKTLTRSSKRSIAVTLILAGCVVYNASTTTYVLSNARLQGRERPALREGALDKEPEQFLQVSGLSRLLEDAEYDTKELDVPTRLVEAGVQMQGRKPVVAWLKAAVASATRSNSLQNMYSDARQYAPYGIADLVEVEVMSMFMDAYGILVYDPESDEFLLLYNEQMHKWTASCVKLASSFGTFQSMLRQSFPERFQGPKSPELAIAIGSGDYPHLNSRCNFNFPHISPECSAMGAPMLQFGSVYRHAEMLPNMIAMPSPGHMMCLWKWSASQKSCDIFTSFGADYGVKFEDLIPQVIWRGTDFSYLIHLSFRVLRPPNVHEDIGSKIDPTMEEREMQTAAVSVLTQLYDILLPRWKGVVLTAEAELEAQKTKEDAGPSSVPWVNIKFSGGPPGSNRTDSNRFSDLAKFGIQALGERMSNTDLARYKYHIDLGGGGGTTWGGTLQKLAMPGLLFHHLTPTKDYIHEWMQPWIHYVPVAADLHDLKEKFDWAEANPQAAKMIADNGSELMRHLGTPEGLDVLYQQAFIEPVRRVIEAYLPVTVTHQGLSWREVVNKLTGDSMVRKK